MAIDVVLASHNAAKLGELQALLAPLGLRLRSIADWGGAAPEETAPSFVENALLKARHASQRTGLPAIADDSGLEVDALAGRPGVRSARYSGPQATDATNNAALLRELAGVPSAQRGARFVCVMTYLRHENDATPLIAQGTWRGRIVESPRGSNGFGYDPLFFLPEFACTSAELPPEVKNRLSHRGQAAAQLSRMLATATRA